MKRAPLAIVQTLIPLIDWRSRCTIGLPKRRDTSSHRIMLRRNVTWVVARPKSVIGLVSLITVVLAFFIGKVQILLDLDA